MRTDNTLAQAVLDNLEISIDLDGWYYKARKTTRPVLAPRDADHCRDMGPCSAGLGAAWTLPPSVLSGVSTHGS